MNAKSTGQGQAFSLIELAMVLALALVLAGIALPQLGNLLRDQALIQSASELSAELYAARRAAQEEGASYALVPETQGEKLLTLWRIGPTGARELVRELNKGGEGKRYGWQLLQRPLPHPTQGGSLERALSSTHGAEIRFAERGSSAATLTLSDGEQRAVCAVIASRTGRFRVFIWNRYREAWVTFV